MHEDYEPQPSPWLADEDGFTFTAEMSELEAKGYLRGRTVDLPQKGTKLIDTQPIWVFEKKFSPDGDLESLEANIGGVKYIIFND